MSAESTASWDHLLAVLLFLARSPKHICTYKGRVATHNAAPFHRYPICFLIDNQAQNDSRVRDFAHFRPTFVLLLAESNRPHHPLLSYLIDNSHSSYSVLLIHGGSRFALPLLEYSFLHSLSLPIVSSGTSRRRNHAEPHRHYWRRRT